MSKYRIVLEISGDLSYTEAHIASVEAEMACYDFLVAQQELEAEGLKSMAYSVLTKYSVAITSVEEIK